MMSIDVVRADLFDLTERDLTDLLTALELAIDKDPLLPRLYRLQAKVSDAIDSLAPTPIASRRAAS